MKERYASKQEGGHKALKVMNDQLSISPYLTGDTLSIADIALYAYTHVADEGGFDLAGYPSIGAWMKRIQSQERYVDMEGNPC